MRRRFAVAHLDGAEGAKFLQHAPRPPEKGSVAPALKKQLLNRRDARLGRLGRKVCVA